MAGAARRLLRAAAMERIDLRIVRAGPRERANVLELLAEHMPEADAARRHEWLYERNPHGPALTMIAYDVASGDPAGITSVFPRRVLCAGKVVLGSIGGDGFVRPAFRRRGIASALHRACLAEMRGDGIEFMFGPPEPYNLRALVHVGSRIVTRVRRYVRPRIAHRALRSFARLTPRTRARIVPLDGADPRVAEVWDRVAASASAHGEEASGAEQGSRPAELVMPVRDPAQYAWRFGRTPAGRSRCARSSGTATRWPSSTSSLRWTVTRRPRARRRTRAKRARSSSR